MHRFALGVLSLLAAAPVGTEKNCAEGRFNAGAGARTEADYGQPVVP